MKSVYRTHYSFDARVRRGAGTLAIVASLAALVASSGWAQSLAGLSALNGTVRDASGAAVTAALVTVANPSLGIERKLTSNSDGYFSVVSLPPASGYEVGVEKPGFTKSLVRNIQLSVGENASVPVVLGVAQQAQAVTVTDSTPLIDQSKSTVSESVENSEIQNLPTNGRRADQFA